ncbi:MAG TPA: hypothetical protein VJY54_11360 [Lachnospiraceae bacterium]|nr:hypothetical protein [Lachnospiraceae bacterium]
MKKAILVYGDKYENEATKVALILQKWDYECLPMNLSEQQKEAYKRLAQDDFDLLVTFDMAGFEKGTETGALFYNLLSCKTIHLLYGDKQAYARYLSNKLSLAMLFFLLGKEEDAQKMKEKYPGIYYIKAFPDDIDREIIVQTAFAEVERKD